MTDLRAGADHFMVFVGVMMLENFAGIGLGMILSASIRAVEMAPQVRMRKRSTECDAKL